MKTLIACLALAASAFGSDLPVPERRISSATVPEIGVVRSESVDVSITKEGRVKLSFPEFKVVSGEGRRFKALVTNSFRVPLSKTELNVFATTGLILPEGTHTFYFDWIDPQEAQSAEAENGPFSVTVPKDSKAAGLRSESVIIDVIAGGEKADKPEGKALSTDGATGLERPGANKSLVVVEDESATPDQKDSDALTEGVQVVSPWRDGPLQWSNGGAIYQHIASLEQMYIVAGNNKVVAVGGNNSRSPGRAESKESAGESAALDNDGASHNIPQPSFEILKSEAFFSLLIGDSYSYDDSIQDDPSENGAIAGARVLEELEGRFEKSIRYAAFSFRSNGGVLPGYYNGTDPGAGRNGTSEVSRMGAPNPGQRNVVKQLEMRKPIVLFTEGPIGGSIIVQFPFAASDQRVRYVISEGELDYTVDHVGPTLGVYPLDDELVNKAKRSTARQYTPQNSKTAFADRSSILPLQTNKNIQLADKSPFSPRLAPWQKAKLLLKKKAGDGGGSGGVTTMSLLSTAPAERAGLRAEYFANQSLTGTPAMIRTDSTVDFTWASGSPGAPLPAGLFSARWRGMVEPAYTQTYTFYTSTSDGVRLWVNGKLLVDNWTNHGVTENSGSIALEAGKKYNILMLYYKNSTGTAAAKLSWSSSSTPKAVIPSNRLYPPGGAAPVITSKEFSSGYGYKSSSWVLEPSGRNTPTTQGSFTVTTSFAAQAAYSAYGPIFTNRILANGLLTGGDKAGQSAGLSITVTGDWSGSIPGGSNYRTSLVIDSIKVNGLKWIGSSGTAGAAVTFSCVETTSQHSGTSAAVTLKKIGNPLGNLTYSGNYTPLEWDPADFYSAGTSMTRTFTVISSDGTTIPLDGVEIVARVKVTSDPPALESAAFSSGYGYAVDAVDPNTAKWKLEASSLNTPTTQGNFSVTPQFASQPVYSSYGPQFTNRTIENGPVGGNGKSALSSSLSIAVNANWSGSVPNSANHRISLLISSISVHGVKWIGSATTGPAVGFSIVETTPNHTGTSASGSLQNIGMPLSNLADKLKYNKLSWDPADYFVDGTSTTRTFTVTASDGSSIPLDGVEIEAQVVVGFDNDAWNTSFEQGLADWNVLPITVALDDPGRDDFAEVNTNRVADGEWSLQLVADNYSPQITVVSTLQPLLSNTPYQQFSYRYFYEHFVKGARVDDWVDREFGSRLRLYDSTGAAITTAVFERPGGYISDGNWFPAVYRIQVPSNAAYYTIEFYWLSRTGKVAFDGIQHTPLSPEPEPTQTGVRLSQSDGNRDLWLASPMEKVYQDVPVPPASPAATTIQLRAAQRESESIQLVYRPKNAETFTSISVGNLTKTGGQTIAASNVSFRYVSYLDITVSSPDDDGDVHPSDFGRLGLTPDPLRPTTPGALAANVSLPIWITASVPAGTVAGVYSGTVVLSTGSTVKNIPIEVEVFGFAIPEKPHMKIMASNSTPINRVQLRQRLKANRIFSEMAYGTGGTFVLPVTFDANFAAVIDWPAWDTMMQTYQSTDGLTYFIVPALQIGDISGPGNGGNWFNNPALPFGSDNWKTAIGSYVSQVSAHLQQNGWLQYAVWKIWDEPFKVEFAHQTKVVADLIRTHAPNAKICVTSWPQPALYDAPIDIWLQPKPTFVAELPTPVTGSNESWIYDNDLFLLDRPCGLTAMRNNAWWMWNNNVKGLLWWNVAYGWGGNFAADQDPYEGQDGGGYLFYSGTYTSQVDDSMRVASFRDSVDDYDYFTMLSSAQDSRKTALGLALAPTGQSLVKMLIGGAEGKNDPLALERSRLLTARLISFLAIPSEPVVFAVDSGYLTSHQLKGYVTAGTTIVNGSTSVALGPNNSFTIDYTLPTIFTKAGVPYSLPAVP